MENFYLKPNEELFSIIDRIKKSRDDKIVLTVPGGLSALRSIINLRILKEEAIGFGKEIVVVTSDNLIKKLAQQSGLEVSEKPVQIETEEEIKAGLSQLKDIEPKRVMSDIVRLKPAERSVEEEPLEDESEKAPSPKFFTDEFEGKKEEQFEELFERPVKKEKFAEPKEIVVKKSSFKFFTKKRIRGGLIVVALVVLGIFIAFVLPRAQVVIEPKKETIRFETEILADKNANAVDSENSIIPGQIFQLEMESSKKFPTTGEKDIEEKAKGTVTVYNGYSSDPQTLVKTTRFLSENGKLFRLIETTVIPGATIEEGQIIPNSKDVEIEADEAGESYNMGPSNFTIPGFQGTPKYEAFYGQAKDSMSGGAKGRMRVATKDDIEGATEIVALELKNNAEKEFNKKIPSELKLLENSQALEIIESSSTLEPDDPGKDFVIAVKVRAWGIAFKEDNVFSLVKEVINNKISENKFLLLSTITISYDNTEIDSKNGKATFSCSIEADTAWKINEQEIKNQLAGKNEIEVRKYLSSLAEIETARVVFWPFWVKKIPKADKKIKIMIDTEN